MAPGLTTDAPTMTPGTTAVPTMTPGHSTDAPTMAPGHSTTDAPTMTPGHGPADHTEAPDGHNITDGAHSTPEEHTSDHQSDHQGPHGECTCPLTENATAQNLEIACNYDSEYHTCVMVEVCEHVHGHSDPPYAIFFIFFSFVLGACVRYFFSAPPLNMIPYTILLFIIGVIIGIVARTLGSGVEKYIAIADIDPHLIMFIFLPILIFESAFSLDWHIFRKVLVYCLVLAGPGILLATGLTALLVRVLFTTGGVGVYDWSWVTCILYGAIVSATDPVAVVALLKELGAPASIASLIEGESLLNDGTAIVLFNILKASVVGGVYTMTAAETLKEFVWVAAGGPLVGLVVGIISEWCLSKVFNDALIEITITVCAAYMTFFIAEGFLHVSGVLALVTMGVWISHHRQAISPEVEHTLHEFWEMTVYLTNTLIFVLVGVIASSSRFDSISITDVGYVFVSYLIINVARLVLLGVTYKPLVTFATWTLGRKEAVLVWWGGLRGAVGLALTLLVAYDQEIKCVHPDLGTQFLFHVVGLVALTLVVNGITAQFVVKYFQLAKIPVSQKRLLESCFNTMLEKQHDKIRELKLSHVLSDANWQVVNRYTYEGVVNPYLPSASDDEEDALSPEEEARMAYFKIIKSSMWEQYEHGFISKATIPRVLKFIDRAKAVPGLLIKPEVLNKYWNESFVASKVGGLSLTLPVCGSTLSSFATKWKEHRWAAGFDVANCLIRAHEEVLHKIDLIVPDCKAANMIKSHCKSLRAGCFAHVQDLSKERVQISVAIQTRHAARTVLNEAREAIHKMQKQGKIDEGDAPKLTETIEKKMNKLMKASSHMSATDLEAVIQDEVKWMKNVEFACAQEFKVKGRTESYRKRDKIMDRDSLKSGFIIILSGVVRVKLNNGKDCYFGTGDCVGLSTILCKTPFLTEVLAETDMKAHKYSVDMIVPWMEKYPLLEKQLWKAAAVEAAYCIMSRRDAYADWKQLELMKYCESGVLLSSDKGVLSEEDKASMLHAGMHHILVKGHVMVGNEKVEGAQVLKRVNGKVTLGDGAKILSIDDVKSKGGKARARWAKIRSKIELASKDKHRGQTTAAERMAHCFGGSFAVEIYESPRGRNSMTSAFISSPTLPLRQASNGDPDAFSEPLLNDVWKEMQPMD
eukprot:TRINITY_DN4576_c0_g1_i1.p1 TRINITY_DN4576_c0_g1~~TRINITY_DN4576_c0_g1_i1.p1  ORF type:complete len:1232 (+),score=421.04 TRINITY_DN4576_c0_g1_i1:247-3696(+)